MHKYTDLRPDWVSVFTLPFHSCLTSGKLLNFSGLWLLIYKLTIVTGPISQGCCDNQPVTYSEHVQQCLVHQKCYWGITTMMISFGYCLGQSWCWELYIDCLGSHVHHLCKGNTTVFTLELRKWSLREIKSFVHHQASSGHWKLCLSWDLPVSKTCAFSAKLYSRWPAGIFSTTEAYENMALKSASLGHWQ